jgi:hypothetical protein
MLVVAVYCLVWLIGVAIPPAQTNCRRTCRDALSLVRLLASGRDTNG